MADLSVEITGLALRNPILTAAGPGARDGDTLLAAAKGGAGGLVAKTVSVSAARQRKSRLKTGHPQRRIMERAAD
jgi:dihydroorotate dehydrogenase